MAQKAYRWPEHFTVGVLKVPNLETPEVVKKWTQILAQDTGMKVHLAYSNDNTKAIKFRWLRYGIVDIADGGGVELRRLLEGLQQHADRDTGPFQIRIVWVMSKYDSGYVVRGDSHIKSVYDIKPGIRVVDMRPYMASRTSAEALLAWAGIKNPEQDVVWVPAHSAEEKVRLIVEGKADVTWAIPSAPAIYEAEKNPHGLRWIDLNPEKDPEGAGRFFGIFRLIDFGPMFRGVQSARGHWGLAGIDQYCCRSESDPGFIYNLVKWLNENWSRYKDLHPWLTQTTLSNLMERLDNTFIPCHDGLIKYLRELGLWTEAHEKRQKENVALVTMYCQANREAIWLADDQGIVVSANNPEWIKLWERHKKDFELPIFNYVPSLGKRHFAP